MSRVFPSVSILIPRLKSGDEQAWSEVHTKFRIGLTSKARQLVRTSGAIQNKINPDDLVQETLLKVWRNRETFRGDSTGQLAKWILTTLRNTFLDICRRKNIEQSQETWREVFSVTRTPSEIASSIEQESELLAALEELSPKQQRVIAMRVFEGLSFPKIAELTETNVNTIAGIYRRGLIRVSTVLKKTKTFQANHFEQ